jgi:DNA processing protein
MDVIALTCLRPLAPDTSAERALKELLAAPPGLPFDEDADRWLHALAAQLQIAPGERDAAIANARRLAEDALREGTERGLTVVTCFDPRYPAWLREIVDPPIVLWVRGELTTAVRPAVAVVGSRHATPTGLALGRQLGEGLGAAGLTVVSGLARGVDGAAHEGALAAGGTTIGVLGCGADIVYPSEHRDLTARVAASGGVLSEFLPGTPPRPHHFPLRNRIIAGLSRAVVVIEAGDKSGSLITARMAMEQGREVLAVPGNPLSGRNRGCHALIKDGATLVETVGDVLTALGWDPRERCGEDSDKLFEISELEGKMSPGESYGVDLLASMTGRKVSDLLAELAALEIDGRLIRRAGGWTRPAAARVLT